jgi:polysaccharide pyruvyl transferase WcaK-like protein
MHAGLIEWLRRARPGLRPVFLSNNPDETTRVYGVESVLSPDASLAQAWTRETPVSTRQRIGNYGRGMRFIAGRNEFRDQLAGAAACFIPGTGSMNSLWWHDWLYVKTWQTLAARRAGVPVFATSQGVGPEFFHRLDRLAARLMFNACQLAGVRDGAQSADLLLSCGVKPARIVHTGDDALLVAPDTQAAERLLGGFSERRPLISLNLRDSSGYRKKYPKPAWDFWKDLVRTLAAHPSAPNFLFVPISYNSGDDDRVPARRLIEILEAEGIARERFFLPEDELEAPALRALAERADLAIGISYHFLVFSLTAGIPAFGLWQNPYYQTKTTGLMALHGLPDHAIELEKADPVALADRALAVLETPASVRDPLRSTLARLARESSSARDRILALLPANAP